MTVNGIDVSSFQPTDYDTTNLGFVMVKVTEGTGYVNPHHAGQVTTGRTHGLVIGHYHFVRPGSMSAQAAYFLEHAGAQPGDILCLDWEDPGVNCADKDAWLRYVEEKMPHNRVVLYCNRDFWFHRDTTSFCGDGLWIADPDAPAGHPRIQHSWIFHQYSETGGIDHNISNLINLAALKSWAAKGGSAPPPHRPPVSYVPFPGATWFYAGRRSPIVAAMHDRLVAEGCNRYQSSTDKDVIGSGDIASYEAWQRKCGYNGKAATWPPGRATWDRLKVPRI